MYRCPNCNYVVLCCNIRCPVCGEIMVKIKDEGSRHPIKSIHKRRKTDGV